MSNFIQLHLLTCFPPSNLNRDDLGRPKTAMFGGTQRLRVSSQCLKRSARLAPEMEAAVGNGLGTRTLIFGEHLREQLAAHGANPETATKIAENISDRLSPLEKDRKKHGLKSKVITFYSAEEIRRSIALGAKLVSENRTEPTEAEIASLSSDVVPDADVALFGRMIADKTSAMSETEGAASVAHAITVHPVAIESDAFTAVDDLQNRAENAGAAHLSDAGFAAGVFYTWASIDWDLLVHNLRGDAAFASQAVKGFVGAMLASGPGSKKRAYGSITRPRFVMVERGQETDNLCSAFLKGITDDDILEAAGDRLEAYAQTLSENYDRKFDRMTFRATQSGSPKLPELVEFAAQPFPKTAGTQDPSVNAGAPE